MFPATVSPLFQCFSLKLPHSALKIRTRTQPTAVHSVLRGGFVQDAPRWQPIVLVFLRRRSRSVCPRESTSRRSNSSQSGECRGGDVFAGLRRANRANNREIRVRKSQRYYFFLQHVGMQPHRWLLNRPIRNQKWSFALQLHFGTYLLFIYQDDNNNLRFVYYLSYLVCCDRLLDDLFREVSIFNEAVPRRISRWSRWWVTISTKISFSDGKNIPGARSNR